MAPPAILREQLAAARGVGASFDEAWPAALTVAVDASQWKRAEWREVLSGMIETWRAAWERRDVSGTEHALRLLVPPATEHRCLNVRVSIAAGRYRPIAACAAARRDSARIAAAGVPTIYANERRRRRMRLSKGRGELWGVPFSLPIGLPLRLPTPYRS
jgi:hypothetical protein